MAQSGEVVIRVEGLRKYYGDVKAVDGVTFEVGRGEVFGMLGPNGAGKTTTIEVLEGLRPPDSGTVEVFGLDVRTHGDSIKQRIGVQLQTVSLYPRLTVSELLDLFGSFYRKHIPTKQLIDSVDLEERAHARSMNLSGGQQQRLSIARALAIDPEVLLLDEPCSALDPISTAKIEELLFTIENRCTLVIVTHNMAQAARVADYTGFFLMGKLIEFNDTKTIFTNPAKKETEDYITGRFG